MATLYYADYTNPDFTQQRIIASFLNIELGYQQIPNKYAQLNLVVENNLLLHSASAISVYLAAGSKLAGSKFQEQVQVYSWLEYFNVQLFPLLQEAYGQIFGKVTINQKKYTYATQQLKRVLKLLDDRLKFRSYIVGNNLTLVDIVLCTQLQKAFRLIIASDQRKKIVNLTRWYTYVRNLQPFTQSIGKMFLCEQTFKISFQNHENKTNEGVQVKNSDQNKQKKQQNKSQKQPNKKKQSLNQDAKVIKKQEKKSNKKQQAPSVQKKQKNQQQKQQDVGQKQGQFSLDNFKRSFQNSENKQQVIDELLNNFPEGWSIWKVYYSKDVTQGKIDYLTSNLAKGTLQRLEQLRKVGFGNWGVYHNEQQKQYQIRGVMLWKGEEIAIAWKQHPSFEYHIFHKMSPKNPEDQQIIKSYWLQKQKSEGLILYDSFKLI